MPSTPTLSAVPALMVPASLKASPEILARYDAAWRRMQAGDTGHATSEFNEVLRRAPGFYPASTALGYIAALDRHYDEAVRRFDAAIALDQTYLPALTGRLDVALVRREDMMALATAEKILAIAPDREDVRSQQEVLRLRVVQAQLTRAASERSAGRLDAAQATLDDTLSMVPDSAVVLRELALVEIARGRFDAAEAHARRSLELDPGDAQTHVVMATVFENTDRPREAVSALNRAVNIDPRPEWRERAAALKGRADDAALPAEYRAIPDAPTVTRGQLAAMLGIRVSDALARAPRRATVVVTDVRRHWAAQWILPVTSVGWMEPFANHTFQPSALVRRADLARVMWRAVQDLAAGQPAELSRWRASRPVLPDVPRAHLDYGAIAGALASGTMQLGEGDRFQSNRPATGAEVVAAVERLEQLARQWGRQ
ncbi:MAG TPA: tetratricopeptide repeat protein [Vicinamibacterales bacterium]|nr:tetratricopeptide repeat protein [Vicinamibacterales bacterium]